MFKPLDLPHRLIFYGGNIVAALSRPARHLNRAHRVRHRSRRRQQVRRALDQRKPRFGQIALGRQQLPIEREVGSRELLTRELVVRVTPPEIEQPVGQP